MQSVAAAWLVLQLSHDSAFALAVFGAFSYGPVLIFGLYAGTVVDRFSHRDVLLVTQAVSLAGAAPFSVLPTTPSLTPPPLILLAAPPRGEQAPFLSAPPAHIILEHRIGDAGRRSLTH